MYIHMFSFHFKPGVTDEKKRHIVSEIRQLQGQIPGLLETHAGLNVSQHGQGYEMGGVMKFVDEKALHEYADHPIHQQLLSWLMPLIEPIEVDFEA